LQKENRVTISQKIRLALCLVLLFVTAAVATVAAFAQELPQSSRIAPRENDANFETQLYLILATNRETEEGKMPVTLQPVLNRLHETLTFKHYSLAASFLNRVKHNGRLEMTWVGRCWRRPLHRWAIPASINLQR
jgi:hypothetical protein